MTSASKVNVLIVDDNPAKMLALKTALALLDLNIVEAGSGPEALRHLLNMEVAVILMDVSMPGMDGFETAMLVRQRPKTAHTPIIFVTAVGTNEADRAKGYSLGAVDYLFTPVPSEIIRAKVASFVDLYQMSAAIKLHAEQLAVLNLQLEERFREVERLNRELENANKELEAFSYSVSHDLRAPLRTVHAFSQALWEDYHDQLDDQGKKFLRRIRAGTRRMNQLIDDLLQLSRVSRAAMSRHTVDLSALVSKIAADLAAAHPERLVTFTIAPDIKVQGDGSLLLIALENLVGNAWKYTSKQTEAQIDFGQTRSEDGTDVYFVRDNGAGFDMNYVKKLFTPFQRLHAESQFPGTGIGLATVQRIIHRHGGRIWAQGAVGQGATFYFIFDR